MVRRNKNIITQRSHHSTVSHSGARGVNRTPSDQHQSAWKVRDTWKPMKMKNDTGRQKQ